LPKKNLPFSNSGASTNLKTIGGHFVDRPVQNTFGHVRIGLVDIYRALVESVAEWSLTSLGRARGRIDDNVIYIYIYILCPLSTTKRCRLVA